MGFQTGCFGLAGRIRLGRVSRRPCRDSSTPVQPQERSCDAMRERLPLSFCGDILWRANEDFRDGCSASADSGMREIARR